MKVFSGFGTVVDRTVRPFWRNSRRCLAIGWRLGPKLFLGRIVIRVTQGLLPLMQAYIAGRVINLVVASLSGGASEIRQIVLLVVAGGAVSLLGGALQNLSFYANRLYETRFQLLVQTQLFEHFGVLDHTYYEDGEFNKKLNKINQNQNSVRNFSDGLFELLSDTVEMVSSGLALLVLNPLLVPFILVTLSPSMIVEVNTNYRRWRSWDHRGDDWRMLSWARGILLDTLSTKEVHLLQLRNFFIDIWQRHYGSAQSSMIEIERKAYTPRQLASLVQVVRDVIIQLWLLTKVLAKGSFGLGDFQFYRQIVQNFSSASSAIANDLHSLQEEMLYVEEHFAMLNLQPRLTSRPDAHQLPSGSLPRIEFQNVSFKYPSTTKFVLQNLSFVIEPGEAVAIVGANGAGKSTLIKLLLRFYDPSSGQILIDGRDLREIDLLSWYRCIGVLFQDFGLYQNLTVADNIALGQTGRREERSAIKEAARLAGADGFVEDLELGYDQRLNKSFSDGTSPSGGQWQRLALARAFFRNAGILILDEPTSAIDAKGEFEIFTRIAKTQKGKTTIIISHRFSTVRNARKIYVIQQGKIIESGSHAQLMELSQGKYRHLFELQAQGYR
jgi:ATP-binding cassette, subfamily B, bacterial